MAQRLAPRGAVRCRAGAVRDTASDAIPALRSGATRCTASGKELPDSERSMSNTEIEIVVDDPTAPEPDSPAVTNVATVDAAVSLLLLALAATLGYDNWRTGISWDSTGPQPGYFPFYLSVILGSASVYGLVTSFVSRREAAETFVTRAQLRRVMAVFLPTLLF